MTRFKITVRMIDNTTEITIEARQPMRETLARQLPGVATVPRHKGRGTEIHACD